MSKKSVALVTGAAHGIGKATALLFAERGYDLGLIDVDEKALDAVKTQCEKHGASTFTRAGDLADIEIGENFVKETAEALGALNALVNNAAWRTHDTIRNISLGDWEKTLRICLTVPAFLARKAAEEMVKRKTPGAIINISSIAAEIPGAGNPAYTAAKGGIDSLTYDLAVHYGPRGIRSIAIRPGAIDTELSRDYRAPDGTDLTELLIETSEDEIPLGRWGHPEEVARAIVWLAGPEASYINGTTLTIDGGWTRQIYNYSVHRAQHPEDFK